MRAEKRRRFVLDGERFWDIESFYDEAVSVFTDGFSAFGRSIPAFGELLCGGHGRHAAPADSGGDDKHSAALLSQTCFW